VRMSRSGLRFSRTPTGAVGGPATRAAERFRTVVARVAEWVDAAADYYAAATLYEQLSRLSDAELLRRGLSRTRLAGDVADAHRRWHGSTG
jgi:hypothetical protein